jgi:hypothetical protein
MSASASLLGRIAGANPVRLLQPQSKVYLRNAVSKRIRFPTAAKDTLSLSGTQGRPLTTKANTGAGPEGYTIKPEVRLEELNRLGIAPYPRYQTPKVPAVLVRDLIQEYDHRLESGTKDETKKVSICGTALLGRGLPFVIRQ